MTACSILGIGLYAPGLTSPAEAGPVLRGERAYRPEPLPPPRLDCLPRNERRRTTATIRLAMAAAQQAIDSAQGFDPSRMATVFSSSNGDMPLVDSICSTLASSDRALSPTQFHNSVHNAPAGYWSIATQSQGPSGSVGAYDASFACGLLEAAILCQTEALDVLYVAYEQAAPEPLHEQRSIDDDFAVAFVLAPPRNDWPQLKLGLAEDEAVTGCEDPDLERLRANNPAARSLPLLAALAGVSSTRIQLPYLEASPALAVTCTPR